MSGLDCLLSNFDLDSSDSEEITASEQTCKDANTATLPSPTAGTSARLVRKETILERSVSGTFKKFNTAEGKVEDTRLLVLQELITSEQDYVKDLAYIVQVGLFSRGM